MVFSLTILRSVIPPKHRTHLWRRHGIESSLWRTLEFYSLDLAPLPWDYVNLHSCHTPKHRAKIQDLGLIPSIFEGLLCKRLLEVSCFKNPSSHKCRKWPRWRAVQFKSSRGDKGLLTTELPYKHITGS